MEKIFGGRKRVTKPLQEKVRRARINKSLEELKSLLLGALCESVSMGRVEVLQMAVKCLRYHRRLIKTGTNSVHKAPNDEGSTIELSLAQVDVHFAKRRLRDEAREFKRTILPNGPSASCLSSSSNGLSIQAHQSMNQGELCSGWRPLQERNQARTESPSLWQPWR